MMLESPDMDNYTDDFFKQEQDTDELPDSFVACLPRYQRAYVVEVVLTYSYPLYVIDEAIGPAGEPLNNTVELHCSDPGWKQKHINKFWEIFDVKSARFRK